MTATRLIIWRHGLTDFNAAGRFQGQADIPLNATGVAQAEQAAALLAAYEPHALYSSPLQRAWRTAEALRAHLGGEIQADPRLEEINVGTWSGKTQAEVSAECPEFAQAMAERRDFRRADDGETATETGARVGTALREIAERHSGQTVVVVSHGLAIRMGVANVLGWDYRAAIDLAGMKNCAWSILDLRDGWWRLQAWNVALV